MLPIHLLVITGGQVVSMLDYYAGGLPFESDTLTMQILKTHFL